MFLWVSATMSFFCTRINNDLLLWEPTAPSPVETVENIPYGVGLSVASQLINTYSKDSFSQFRSTGPEGKDHLYLIFNIRLEKALTCFLILLPALILGKMLFSSNNLTSCVCWSFVLFFFVSLCVWRGREWFWGRDSAVLHPCWTGL